MAKKLFMRVVSVTALLGLLMLPPLFTTQVMGDEESPACFRCRARCARAAKQCIVGGGSDAECQLELQECRSLCPCP